MKKLIFIFSLLVSLGLTAQDTKKISYKNPDSLGVFTFVEHSPEFRGGDAALIKFLQEHMVYPEEARKKNIEGRVLLRFVVNKKGAVKDVQVMSGVDPELDAEAVRVASMLPKFKPGTQQGKKVKVYYNLPIVFKLQ